MYVLPLGKGTHQNLSCVVDFFSITVGDDVLLSLLVIFFESSYPLSNDFFKVSSNVKVPFAAPNVVSFCFDIPGKNASISLLKVVLFPDWEAKCIVGVQKPETQIQSQLIFSRVPNSFLSSEILATSADLTFLYQHC